MTSLCPGEGLERQCRCPGGVPPKEPARGQSHCELEKAPRGRVARSREVCGAMEAGGACSLKEASRGLSLCGTSASCLRPGVPPRCDTGHSEWFARPGGQRRERGRGRCQPSRCSREEGAPVRSGSTRCRNSRNSGCACPGSAWSPNRGGRSVNTAVGAVWSKCASRPSRRTGGYDEPTFGLCEVAAVQLFPREHLCLPVGTSGKVSASQGDTQPRLEGKEMG